MMLSLERRLQKDLKGSSVQSGWSKPSGRERADSQEQRWLPLQLSSPLIPVSRILKPFSARNNSARHDNPGKLAKYTSAVG
jgi:hypothetical protein